MGNSKLEKDIKKYKNGEYAPYIRDMIEEFKERNMKSFRCFHFDCIHCPFNELLFCDEEEVKEIIIKYNL